MKLIVVHTNKEPHDQKEDDFWEELELDMELDQWKNMSRDDQLQCIYMWMQSDDEEVRFNAKEKLRYMKEDVFIDER